MAVKSLHQTVEEAFDAETREAFGDKYLEVVYENWSEAVRTLRRTWLLLVLAAVAFLVLDHASNAKVDLGPLQIDNISAVLILIPMVASFLLFEVVDLAIAGSYYKEVASASMKLLHPSIYKHDLQVFLEPTTGFALGVGSSSNLKPTRPGRLQNLREWVEVMMVFGVALGGVGFIVYAFASLYGDSRASVLAVSVSLIFTLFNLARGALTVAVTWSDLTS